MREVDQSLERLYAALAVQAVYNNIKKGKHLI
ncbi:hypothetical protein SAMN04488694_1305 [Natrinema hispanicum]|uniref:Uncharacterized protein n=1 Tax=Natrinema hispanicum TaxID=392421 RepID=A0A1I0J3J5_9EURY|nr:hypothetical protein SAMN04488694_1305 [Natrinema hispanicum]